MADSKIVAIHQPNFVPWSGFFHKILSADVFVLIDIVQYAQGSVCNRNRIKDSSGKTTWLTVPVSMTNGSSSSFREVVLANKLWYRKALNQVRESYRKAPFFERYFTDLEKLFSEEYSSLAEMNISSIRYFCLQLGINTPIYVQSEQTQDFGKKNDLNLGITKYFNGTIYLSGNGARKYNDHQLFEQNNVTIQYQEYSPKSYKQSGDDFVENLSILDMLFNVGDEARKLIEN